MIRRALPALTLLALGAVLLVVAWPQLLGLQRALLVVQVATLRGLLLGIALLLAVLTGVLALATPRARRFLAGLTVLLLGFSAIQFAVLSTRGVGATPDPAAARDVTVVAWNTLGDAVPVSAVATLALDEGADIVVLPESSRDFGVAVSGALADSGIDMQVLSLAYDAELTARSTVVLIARDLGEYVADESVGGTSVLPSIVAIPVDGDGPTIVAAHPIAPVPRYMREWSDSLAWLAERCAGEDVIVAGDLNSTLDHYTGLDAASDASGGIGGCRDAARVTGNAAVGTWPVALPPLLGAPIDHVLATAAWEVVGYRVATDLDAAGSDHRPIVAHLLRAD